ncbi:hypothetical protein [Rhodococcus sp. X156]|uniref:hypothetical protein n=1 Tax=Rhodococcus sp. X156 TaxID=2499145 RepID=UPI0013E39270|nr:hypothetical protein [Rhodococcus sp. X156]
MEDAAWLLLLVGIGFSLTNLVYKSTRGRQNSPSMVLLSAGALLLSVLLFIAL